MLKMFKRLFGKKDKREVLQYKINPPKDERDYAQQQSIANLKAQVERARIEISKIKKKELTKQEKEQEEIEELQEQIKEIKHTTYGETVSLGKFYYKLFTGKNPPRNIEQAKKGKFAKDLEVSDNNDTKVLGKFGDFLLTKENADVLVTDSKGDILIKGESLKDVIFKAESFDNQLRRGRICLAIDEKYHHVEDIEKMIIPDIIYNSEINKYEENKNILKPLKDLLYEKAKIISELHNQNEMLENVKAKLKDELDSAKRANELLKKQTNMAQSRLSEAMTITANYNSKIGDIQTQLALISEQKAYNEKSKLIFEAIVDKLLLRMEQTGERTIFEEAKQMVYEDLKTLKSVLPEKIIEIKEEKSQDIGTIRPGTQIPIAKPS